VLDDFALLPPEIGVTEDLIEYFEGARHEGSEKRINRQASNDAIVSIAARGETLVSPALADRRRYGAASATQSTDRAPDGSAS
jgi:hypothetical protein